ncbi:MAG TPA: hypothetical protein VN240_10510, partial [Propylenella sp.]|nr:hypothetical protein [Propylenella sp.]
IMMAIHSRQIYEILAGRDAGWSSQRRDGDETSWREAWRRHCWHMLAGLVVSIAAWFVSPAILAWLSPTVAGLVLAVPLSRASGSARLGLALRRAGLLVTPEESRPPQLFEAREAVAAVAPPLPDDGIAALVTDENVRNVHFRWAGPAPSVRGAPDAAYLTASEKTREARALSEALAWLNGSERLHIAGQLLLAEALAKLPRGDGSEHGTRSPAGHVERSAEQTLLRHSAA